MEKVKVLYILNCPMNYGGTEAYIMNYYRHMDKDVIQFDFVYRGAGKGVYDDELVSYGSKIYWVPTYTKHPFKYTRELKQIIRNGGYKIIHSNIDAMGAWPITVAKQMNVQVRIAHSHNTSHQTNNPFKKMANDVAKKILRKNSTNYFACGVDAAVFLFGEKLVNHGKVELIKNGIDFDEYRFSEKARKKIRNELSIGKEMIVGHVGQFREQKNHRKIVSVFKEVLKKDPSAKLMLVGDGELKSDIENYLQENHMIDNVIFMGNRGDVGRLLSAMDVFLFPSLYEGLSVVAIEAQANSLPCVFSDMISKETSLIQSIKRIGLNDGDEIWSRAVYEAYAEGRVNCEDKLSKAGYDITVAARKLQERYVQLLKGI